MDNKMSTERLAQRIGVRRNFHQYPAVKIRRDVILKALQLQDEYSCLAPLHGMQGVVTAKPLTFGTLVPKHLRAEFSTTKAMYDQEYGMKDVRFEFDTGTVRFTKRGRARRQRVGKYLKAMKEWAWDCYDGGYDVSERVARIWETRELDWNWRISTTARDIYTMSTDRKWKSCMEFNIDNVNELSGYVAMGSAAMFFSRNGKDCGRILLSPDVTKRGRLFVDVGDLQGDGPMDRREFNVVNRFLSGVFSGIKAGSSGSYSDFYALWFPGQLWLDKARVIKEKFAERRLAS